MGRPSIRSIRALLLVALGSALGTSVHAQPEEAVTPAAVTTTQTVAFEIPAQPLSSALMLFSEQAGVQVTMQGEGTSQTFANAVTGSLSADDALAQMLQGTGLTASRTGPNTFAIQGTAMPGGAAADPFDGGGTGSVEMARRGGVEEIIVTGQKKAERLQDVPIAISAFSMESLDAQKIEGGFDLLKAIPNVTFSKTNFTGYNFQIRGIGTQAVSATSDPGVAVSFNNTTLIVNRLFEQEYLDVERVEVLRGPQGTLYGRNASAGVINVISAKPVIGDEFGELRLEGGNYGAQRIRAHYNLPLGDTLALRAAYGSTVRQGYATNEFDGSDVDNRDLWSGRITLGWEPTDRVRVNLLWERFEEDDERVRSTKQLCHRDPGLRSVAGFDITELNGADGLRGSVLNQGCLPGPLFSDAAYSVPGQGALPFVEAGRTNGLFPANFLFGSMGLQDPDQRACGSPSARLSLLNICKDVYAELEQSKNLRSIYSVIEPAYRADANIYELSVDYQWSDSVTFSSQTVYAQDQLYSTQDYNRFQTSSGIFSDTSRPNVEPFYADVAPGGIYCDPQLGCSDAMLIQDVSQAKSRQFSQEFRFVSEFGGDVDFSFGANYTRFQTLNDYFVFSNLITAQTEVNPFTGHYTTGNNQHPCQASGGEEGCIYVDPNPLDSINGDGHNYFRSANPYRLQSVGLFGETYWRITDSLKLTAGLRYTWDRKVFTPRPSQTLLADYRTGYPAFSGYLGENDPPEACATLYQLCGVMGNAPGGRGYPAEPDIVQAWTEPTGRIVLDWQPILGFTDETLVYASYARGYKGGGANPPGIAAPAGTFIEAAQLAVAPRTFEPEYVNALELGTKNTLFDGALMVNGSVFYYDYKDYQVSKIVNRSANNENFDATIWGAELETVFAPNAHWQFNASVGYLKTEIAEGEQSIDLMDRTQGGGRMHITGQRNPDYDPDAPQVAPEDYVAVHGFNLTGGTFFEAPVAHALTEDANGDLIPIPDGQEFLAYDEWVVMKPNPTQTENCVAPAEQVRLLIERGFYNGFNLQTWDSLFSFAGVSANGEMSRFCPGGNLLGGQFSDRRPPTIGDARAARFPGGYFDALRDAPNGGAGFFADLGGNELPNAPALTVSLGGQFSFALNTYWDATARVDYYWQDESYARVYNTEYDRLKAWSNTNLSFWVENPQWGFTVAAYVKNVFDETPITGTFLNSDDTGLTTNVFTLDPRLVGVSVTKRF
jgi:iron complex outermembrane recepter protein